MRGFVWRYTIWGIVSTQGCLCVPLTQRGRDMERNGREWALELVMSHGVLRVPRKPQNFRDGEDLRIIHILQTLLNSRTVP